MDQIKLPLNVLEREIVVNVFSIENYKMLLKDKTAIGIIDKNPGVYCFYDNESIYIGESSHPFKRLENHIASKKLKNNDKIIVFRSEQFHKSAVYDIETKIIDYFGSEQKMILRNKQTSQGDHEYFLKFAYEPVIQKMWDFFIEKGLSEKTTSEIEQSEIFKFSPYKNLNADQFSVASEIGSVLDNKNIIFVNGKPGTGKSILASSLYNNLSQKHKVCLTSGTIHTAETFKKVFKIHNKTIDTGSKVLKTSELLKNKEEFEIIIIDEAHRLSKSGSKGHPMKYSHIDGDELSMIIKRFPKVVLFYDENQFVHDGDIILEKSQFSKFAKFELTEQMRAIGGYKYILWMVNWLSGEFQKIDHDSNYDFKIYDSFEKMYHDLKVKSKDYHLTRLLSGYTREWVSKDDASKYDFEIDGIKLRWNNYKAVNKSVWINSAPAKDLLEVAYYNVVQGFDLDYAGVIIGKDLKLNKNGDLEIDEDFVVDSNQKPSKKDPQYKEKLSAWTRNRYKVLLSRGTKGTYIFVEDESLRNKLKNLIK